MTIFRVLLLFLLFSVRVSVSAGCLYDMQEDTVIINPKNEIGFNIGYGFGDTSNATENMVFYNGKAHKLEDVKFNIPLNKKGKEDETITSNNKILSLC